MTKVWVHDGKLINVGPWDYCMIQERLASNPWPFEGDPPEDWDFEWVETEYATNPLPEGATEEDREIVESAKGRLLFAEDWKALREDAYPSGKEQMAAFWAGGADQQAMADRIQAINNQYPEPTTE